LHKKRINRGNPEYLVQWEGYPSSKQTWKKMENIPKFIVDYYEKTGQTTIPKPRIKSTKLVGSKLYYLLTWDGVKKGVPEYIPASDFEIASTDIVEGEGTSTCNTR
jgi:hypothetical protein